MRKFIARKFLLPALKRKQAEYGNIGIFLPRIFFNMQFAEFFRAPLEKIGL